MDRSFITVLFFIFAITAKAQEKPILFIAVLLLALKSGLGMKKRLMSMT
jgi:hypothetical protein